MYKIFASVTVFFLLRAPEDVGLILNYYFE